MAKDNTDTRPRLPWAGKQVSLEQVESELTFLWHMAADNMRISQNINVRTSVLNLIICAFDTETARKASALLREVASTHIGRVTILIFDTNSSTSNAVTSWVTLRSFPIISDIMRHHFEQITVQATGSAIRSAANIVQPLLKPDLPVYLWWLGDPPDDETIFHNLINISNRIIVDSSTFFKPEEGISKLSTILQASPNSALSDLNWARVTPWRELIAQFFDASDYRPYLQGVDEIEIEHAVNPSSRPTLTAQGDTTPNPTRALLLAAWLKTRLSWKLTANESYADHDAITGTHTWQMTRIISPLTTRMLGVGTGRSGKLGSLTEGKRISSISIRPRVQSDLRPGTICLVRLTSTLDTKQATFTINREDSDHVLTTVELEQEALPPRTVYIPTSRNQSTLLSDELEIMGHDHLYEETLHEVFSLLA
ncbi:MAG TPA: glucose-6-phosphate dehydrogenase assembly protein OpcA [Ktedonobacteraceae bacterium]|nr:glucose-6-phosphate dehydrogenase assembly protein OpcA [Ktedonobacteraceae bacterium]